MAFNNFPYTDLNDLNIDWLLRAMKEAVTTANNSMEIAQNLKTFVETYFENLDVQQEINNKIDAMAESGELAVTLDPIVTTIVSAWLNQHITPTSPPVDDTFSIQGAAADSAQVGKRCEHWITMTNNIATNNYGNLLANLPQNTYAWCSVDWFTDAPFNSGSFWCETIGSGNPSSFGMQIAYKSGTFYRRIMSNNTYGDWQVNVDSSLTIQYAGADAKKMGELQRLNLKSVHVGESAATDTYNNLMENLPINSYSWVSGSWFTDSPVDSSSVWVETRSEGEPGTPAGSYALQRVFVPSVNLRFYRYKVQGEWFDWIPDYPSNVMTYNGSIGTSTDLNTSERAMTPGVWYGSTPNTNVGLPNKNVGAFLLYVGKQGVTTWQILYSLSAGQMWARFTTSGGASWRDWRSDYKNTKNNYIAFGDSTVIGQIGGGSGNSSRAYPYAVGRVLDMNVYNRGVRGQGLITDWDAINNAIDNNTWNQFGYNEDADLNSEFTDARLISVGWAYNDSSAYATIPFGSVSDTTPTSYLGYYFSIMKKLQERAPQAKIVLVTGYGAPTAGSLERQFTQTYNFKNPDDPNTTIPKTVAEMYDALEEMCHLNGWSCINQHRGTVFNRFNASTMIGDQIHPNQTGYLAYGNFIAAKMRSLWCNIQAL